MQDMAKQVGVNALGEAAGKTVTGGSLLSAAGAVAGTNSPKAISRRDFFGQLGLRGALANSALPTSIPGKAGVPFGSSRVIDSANAVSGVRPHAALVDAITSRGPIGTQQLAPIAENLALSNPGKLLTGLSHLVL